MNMNIYIHEPDVSNAFCCANIEGDVHIYNPPTPDFDLPTDHGFILYGLRSIPQSWWKHILRQVNKVLHFTPCIF